MCEVMAVAALHEVAFESILPRARKVEQLGVAGFGWGVAWLTGDGVRRYRSAVSLADDAEGARSVGPVRSSRFLVHLRRPSRLSTVQLADSQPFLDVPGENDEGTFAFCHNGFLERHEELRPRYEAGLRGRADSEVGFEYFRERLEAGADPADAVAEVHERLGGTANLGYLGADGAMLVYGGYPANAPWAFEWRGLSIAATTLHSDDQSVFDLLFTDATDRRRIGREVVPVEPPAAATRRAG